MPGHFLCTLRMKACAFIPLPLKFLPLTLKEFNFSLWWVSGCLTHSWGCWLRATHVELAPPWRKSGQDYLFLHQVCSQWPLTSLRRGGRWGDNIPTEINKEQDCTYYFYTWCHSLHSNLSVRGFGISSGDLEILHSHFGDNDCGRNSQQRCLHHHLISYPPAAWCSCFKSRRSCSLFLDLTSGCNLVLLNSKDPTVLLAPVQRTSPFIIWSLMNDLVRQ